MILTHASPSQMSLAWAAAGPLSDRPSSVHSLGNILSKDRPSSWPMRRKRSACNGNKQRIGAVECGKNLEPNWLTRRWLGAIISSVIGGGTGDEFEGTDEVA